MENTINTFSIDLPGILKTISYYFPRNAEESSSSNFQLIIKDESGKSIDVNSSNQVVITELPKYNNLFEMTNQYLKCEMSSMNLTIRSKIIYDVAATLKKLHKKGKCCCFFLRKL